MIKIVTGYSGRGGSTTALINLTNALNKIGYPTIFYGKEDYHTKKCKYGKMLSQYRQQQGELLITHFLDMEERPPHAKRIILTCHENELYKVGEHKCFWDECIFLNQNHRNYHSNYTGPCRIIPNLRAKIKKIEKTPEAKYCAGVIGGITHNKQTHVSIQRALDDGYKKVYVFGVLPDMCVSYYKEYIKPLLHKYPDQVILCGFVENKSEMYAMIDAVYLSSLSTYETATHQIHECKETDTIFKGNEYSHYADNSWSNKKIINAWIDVLHLSK